MSDLEKIWNDLVIEFNPLIGVAEKGCLLIGLGTDNEQEGIALNNKTNRYSRFKSVTEIVAKANKAQWDEWRQKVDYGKGLTRIVIEDFSFDTCTAILTFIEYLSSTDNVVHINQPWLDYINAWEIGVYLDGDDNTKSAGCLLSTLSHSYWENKQAINDALYLKKGLMSCLQLLKDMMESNPKPTQGIKPLPTSQYAAALSNIAYEKQIYDHMIKRSVCCQLLIDADQDYRQTVVDALFITESSPSGIFKILARTDRVNSWSHKGFSLLGVYRPDLAGSGNDIVISLEPTSGARLGRLWRHLEDLENRAWQGERPCNDPRYLISYLDNKTGQIQAGAPNQPWYDDQGKMTLIAAPKKISDSVLGSKLQWGRDVLPAIWACYFTQFINESIEQVNLPQLQGYTGDKIIKVYQHNVKSCSKGTIDPLMKLIDTTTFHAWLASHITHDGSAITPLDLPSEDEFESNWYGNILVVSYRKGVVLFSNETANIYEQHDLSAPHKSRELNILIKAVLAVAEMSAEYDHFIKHHSTQINEWINDLLTESKQHVKSKSKNEGIKWQKLIFKTKVQALKALDNSKIIGNDILHNKISDSLTLQWGLSAQRNQLIAQIDRLDNLMRQSIEHKKEKRQRIYGAMFSALALGTAASHIWEPIKVITMTNMYEWLFMLFREEPPMSTEELNLVIEDIIHHEMYSVVILLGFGFLGFILFWFFDFSSKSEHH